MRASAQIWSHNFQASDMVLVSVPMICSVVKSLRTVIWVKRQKKNCSAPACSNHDLARSECTWRLQASASHTLASRKFNVFIDLFVGQFDLRAIGDDERELHSVRTRALVLQEDGPDTCQDQFAHRAPICGGLRLEFSI